MTSNSLIKLRFSKAAYTYDDVSHIHREIVDHLIAMLQDSLISTGTPQPKNIIDIGAGTGILSEKALDIFPNSNITLLDISQDMLSIAQQKISQKNFSGSCSYLEKNAEELDSIFFKNHDLILSSMAIQWFGDIYKFLNNCISQNSVIAFSIPIFGTFYEWYELLKEYDIPVKSIFYETEERIQGICNKITNVSKIEVKEYILKFTSPLDCARYIKRLGANVSEVLYDQGMLRKLFNEKKEVNICYKVFFAVLFNL